jgi:hypothetical protein
VSIKGNGKVAPAPLIVTCWACAELIIRGINKTDTNNDTPTFLKLAVFDIKNTMTFIY